MLCATASGQATARGFPPRLGERRAGRGTAPAGCGDCLVLAGRWRPVEAPDQDRGSPSEGQRLADSHLTRPSDIQLRTTSFPVYGRIYDGLRSLAKPIGGVSPK